MDDKKLFHLNLIKQLGLKIISLTSELPSSIPANVISYQIVKSSTSTGCNYRAVCKSRSTAEFISKMSIVEEEADDNLFLFSYFVF